MLWRQPRRTLSGRGHQLGGVERPGWHELVWMQLSAWDALRAGNGGQTTHTSVASACPSGERSSRHGNTRAIGARVAKRSTLGGGCCHGVSDGFCAMTGARS
jgi:hypothetical protein